MTLGTKNWGLIWNNHFIHLGKIKALGLQDISRWKGPQEVSSPTTHSEQGALRCSGPYPLWSWQPPRVETAHHLRATLPTARQPAWGERFSFCPARGAQSRRGCPGSDKPRERWVSSLRPGHVSTRWTPLASLAQLPWIRWHRYSVRIGHEAVLTPLSTAARDAVLPVAELWYLADDRN